MTKEQIIEELSLEEHPEGGYYKRNYTADKMYRDDQSLASAIYYILGASDISHFHKLTSDELWHHYLGGEILIHTFDREGHYKCIQLGKDFKNNARPQICIPANTWMAAEVVHGDFTLIGCTLSPAFTFDDFTLASRKDLIFAEKMFPNLLDKFILDQK